MSGNILETIARGEYEFVGGDSEPGQLNSAQLFLDASYRAAKILGRSQDRESKSRLGSVLRSEGRKKTLALDARRFTTGIPLGVLTPANAELRSRVTVTEHFGRRNPQRQFTSEHYGAIAVKLFVVTPDEREQEMHLAVCLKHDNGIRTHVNGSLVEPEPGMNHVLDILELTHTALA